MTAPERAALSRELADFLIELSIALHKHAMYPEGHPSLAPAAAGVARRAEDLLETRLTLALGVARQQLVIEGVATDSKNPLLSELAGRLHRHHLGAVTFHRGIRPSEVTDLLKTLAIDGERSGEPLGLGPPERLRVWDHVRLHSVTYERLELLDQEDPSPEAEGNGAGGGGGPRDKAVRAAQLWVGLARAALVAEDAPTAAEPVAIARAIDEHPRSGAYDQVIVGYLLQIAGELKQTGGAEAVSLRRRTSKLIGALQPATLRRLIEMGGDSAQRTKFALDATHGLAVDAVLEIVRAMADASHKTVSDPLVRMLSKLAAHAEHGGVAASVEADEALRDQVRQLLSGWTLEDPNPDPYGRALQRMAAAAPSMTPVTESQDAEPERLLQTGLEVGVMDLPDPAERLQVAGEVRPLWERVTDPALVQRITAPEPPDFATLDRILPRMPPISFEPLLDALAASESRTTRRGLLDRLARAPGELGAIVLARLRAPAPWYVVRNLLVVLDALPGGALPEGFSAAPFAAHEDPRVRREALKLMLKLPEERERALLGALRDSDPRTARLALSAAFENCPLSALPVIAGIARDPEAASELRVLAIKVLGRASSPTALIALLGLTNGGTNWRGRPKLPARSLELIAALMALASGWVTDARAGAVLAIAAASNDPEVRNAGAPVTRSARR